MLRRATLKLLAVAALALSAGCGFQLRGQSPLPFGNAFVDASSASILASHKMNSAPSIQRMDSVLAGQLRNYLAQQGKLAPGRDQAEVIIRLTAEAREKSILSLSGAGKVREYRLVHTVTVSATAPDGREILAPAEIKLSRDFSYSDEQVLAKEAEEAMLHKDMDDDTLRQILRRLAFVRKP